MDWNDSFTMKFNISCNIVMYYSAIMASLIKIEQFVRQNMISVVSDLGVDTQYSTGSSWKPCSLLVICYFFNVMLVDLGLFCPGIF